MKYTDVEIKNILISGTGFDDYLVSFPLENPALAASLGKIGIINPPILIATTAKKLKIICGYKKIAAHKKMGKRTITAKVFDRGEIDDKTALLTAITENVVSRGLNAVEISLAIHKLQKLSVPIDASILELLHIPLHLVLEYTGLTSLDTSIKKAVAEGMLTPAHAFLLEKLEKDDCTTLGRLFIDYMRPNINETKEIIQYLDDLKIKRSKKKMRDILDQDELQHIITDKYLSPREKVERLRDALKRLRYPLITEKEASFNAQVKGLGLPAHLQISHPKYFEGNELKLECRIKTVEELRNILAKLADKTGSIQPLLDLIKH